MNSWVLWFATRRPLPMTIRWSAVCAISLSRCELISTVRPSRARARTKSRTQRMPSGSRPFTGSSRISTSGSPSSAQARPRRWPIPSENLPALRPATSLRPTMPRTSSTRFLENPLAAATQRRCAAALRLGWTHLASSSVPTFSSGRLYSAYALPSMRAVPLVGSSSPTIIRIVVDLPAPLGPKNPVTIPGETSKFKSLTTVLPL